MKKYGSFWSRAAAIVIDFVILMVATMYFGDNSQGRTLSFIVSTAYFVWMHGMYGATVGKMVLKLKVVKENGTKLTYQDALLREIASYLSFIALGIGYFVVFWDPKRQSWHDKLAKTVVLDTK